MLYSLIFKLGRQVTKGDIVVNVRLTRVRRICVGFFFTLTGKTWENAG